MIPKSNYMINYMGEIMEKGYILPQNLIVLISGVPGVGKTTISNELLKTHNEFRLVEETDIIRATMSYNEKSPYKYNQTSTTKTNSIHNKWCAYNS